MLKRLGTDNVTLVSGTGFGTNIAYGERENRNLFVQALSRWY